MTPSFGLFIPLPAGMNIAYWCLPSTVLVESSTLPEAWLLRNTIILSMFYRNLRTLHKFLVIPYSAGTQTLAEHSLCFEFACKKIPKYGQVTSTWSKKLKQTNPHQFSYEHQEKTNTEDLTASEQLLFTYESFPPNHLIGIHVLDKSRKKEGGEKGRKFGVAFLK